MKSASDIRAEWLAALLSTAPADRPRAETGVRALYAAAGFPEPRYFLWFGSPRAASWVVALLATRYHQLWAQKFAGSLTRAEREQVEQARAALGKRLGLADAAQAAAAVGAPRTMHLHFPPTTQGLFVMPFTTARFTLSSDIGSWHTPYRDDDALNRAETHFAGSNRGVLRSALYCPGTDIIIGQSFFADHSFSRMADDERLAGDRELPAIMHAAAEVARSAGLWWPFEHAAILCERPSELHLNDRHLLHRTDGPAAVFRDGWSVHAWNGKAVPENWIMHPDTVPSREYRGFDPTYRTHVEAKAPAKAPTRKKSKPGSILKAVLPSEPAARLEQLRAHAGGRLPRYDRYVSGAHREVWQELVSLGDVVREDAPAADALAVAYETMQRVESNVRTLVERLGAMRYTFGVPAQGDPQFAVGGPQGVTRMDLGQLMREMAGTRQADVPHLPNLANMLAKAQSLLGALTKATQSRAPVESRPHTPPPRDIQKHVIRFEKEYGALPLSLRAFYEVVGEVNLIGSHPTIDPPNNTVAPDPLVVYALDEGAVEYDDGDEEEGAPRAITIAPDDLHKANTSGGDAYEMAIPDLRADGELLNERHNLFFVDYLRLCFRFGGFPVYDGFERVPVELAELSGGLVEF